MSKLDSSWIMMMCGRRPATWQESTSGTFSRSAVTASDSMKNVNVRKGKKQHGAGGEVGTRRHARAGEFGEIAVVVIAAPGFVRPGHGLPGQHGKAGKQASGRRQATDAERIEPPQRGQKRQGG